ncbi:MAG: adenylate/guanylate cyclase domain-containing protein [Polaribacter sp.]|nr:adenylate/guanylate cyclase domain-containing protein [Polaribacter sp.]
MFKKLNLFYKSIKIALFLGIFCFNINYLKAQVVNADSLEQKYLKNQFLVNKELSILRSLSRELKNPQKKLKYSLLLINKSKKLDSVYYLYDAFMQKGNAYRLKSDLTKALESFFEAANIAQQLDSVREVALAKITVGDVYSIMGNHNNSVKYYEDGINVLREIKTDSINLASALLNAGDEYFNEGKYDTAMNLFYESSLICNLIDFKIGKAYNLGNIGMVYAKQNKPKLAEANINEAIAILEGEKDYYPISVYLDFVAEIYLNNKKYSLALNYSKKSLELAKKYQLKDQISKANLMLSNIYENLDNAEESLYHYKEYITFKDSVSNISSVQKIANLRTEYEVSKKQIEVDLFKQQKENERVVSLSILGGLFLMSLIAFGLYRRNRFINKTRKIIDEEKEKSDKLLRNILPDEIAEELKIYNKVEAKRYESVTVLFTDFKEFTKYSKILSPEKLVETVDMYFSEFDRIIEKYNLEKIKTIGDAYMCAGGLPIPSENHAEDVAKAAIEIKNFVKKVKQMHGVNEVRFDIKLGMHSGPVVAGIVGQNKFSYDIWGDTVNVASRIESSSESGKINVSQTTFELLKNLYSFEERGEISIKNGGEIKMYFLNDNNES